MVSTSTPVGAIGWPAVSFDLPGIDGRRHTLASASGQHGTVVMFICNHCPYVKAVADRIGSDMRTLKEHGIGSIAIMANDASEYPEDSYDNMKIFAEKHGFAFPYVMDDSQQVARAYGAVCTPDFFGFDRNLRLAYRGRLDASGRAAVPDTPRELAQAMLAIARGEAPPAIQHPSIGCSIKWKEALGKQA